MWELQDLVLFVDAIATMAKMPAFERWRVSLVELIGRLNRRKRGRTYRVNWIDDYEEFVGTCDQYPSLSWLAGNRKDARRGIENLVAWADADLAAEIVEARGASRQIRVTYDAEKKQYIAACDAYPALKWESRSRKGALEGSQAAARDYERALRKIGKRRGGAAAAPADGTAETPVRLRPPSDRLNRIDGNGQKEKDGARSRRRQ